MFTAYVEKAMQQAEYEQMEDGNWWGQVTPLRYTWSTGPTKEACAKELRDVVEDWLIDAIACHDPIPVIDGVTIDFTGPYPGGKHEIMRCGTDRAVLPNPHQGDISVPTLARILREIGVTRDEWERL